MKIKEKHKIVVFLFSVLILIISLFSYWTLKKEQIKIIVNDKVIITSSFKKNIKDLLDEKGIKYDNNDKITPNLNDELKDYMEINIVNVDIKKTDIEKQYIEDKYSRLDVKATTSNDEIINIEIQLKNENNMVKRSLYYLSKMYEEQLNEKEDYSKLVRTVCINILNFKYLKTDNFHTGYRFKEIESNEELTDIMEVHFIEIPKLQDSSDEKDMLVAWTEFLKDPESEKVRGLELSIEEIRQAKDELIRMSNDSTQRELYDMRANSLRDKMSELNAAERKGIEKGREEEKIKIARNMKLNGLDTNTIAKVTNLSEDEIDKL